MNTASKHIDRKMLLCPLSWASSTVFAREIAGS
jgi:hypothetical protein